MFVRLSYNNISSGGDRGGREGWLAVFALDRSSGWRGVVRTG